MRKQCEENQACVKSATLSCDATRRLDDASATAMSRTGPFEKDDDDDDDDGVSTAVAEPRGPGSVRDGEEEKDVVERSGWRRRRRRGGNDDDDGQRYEFGATHGNALIGHVVSKEEMAAMATMRGVRMDEDVEATFGVLIPGSSSSGIVKESLVRAARRYGVAAQRHTWKTRLETKIETVAGEDDDDDDDNEDDVDENGQPKPKPTRVRFVTEADPVLFDVEKYEQTTSKYINSDYFAKRVAPMVLYPDGTTNATPMRVASWIFGEEYVKRDGFVESDDDDEDDESAEEKEEPALRRKKSRKERRRGAREDDVNGELNASQRGGGGWCGGLCGGSEEPSPQRGASTEGDERTESEDEVSIAEEKFDVEKAQLQLAGFEYDLDRLDLNAVQKLSDARRLARELSNNFTLEMLNSHPRALEIKTEIRLLETDAKKIIFTRETLKKTADKLRKTIQEYVMRAPSVVAAEKGHSDERTRARADALYIPLTSNHTLGGMFGTLFLAYSPLYLWHYYEWIQINRPQKRHLWQKETTARAELFYNPLLVAGARRMRLPASRAEIFAMLLAVQSLVRFQFWVIDQPPEELDGNVNVYKYLILHAFVVTAAPVYNTHALAVKRRRRRGKIIAIKKLWVEDEKDALPEATKPRLKQGEQKAAPIASGNLTSFADDSEDVGAEVASRADTASLSAYSREEIASLDDDDRVTVVSQLEDEVFRESIKNLSKAEQKKAWRERIKQEASERNISTLYDGDDYQAYGGFSRTQKDASLMSSGLTSFMNDSVDGSVESNFEKLRKEYVKKARAERKQEEEAKNGSKKSIFDVSDLLSNLLPQQKPTSDRQATLEQANEIDPRSRLAVDGADSVLKAVSRLTAKHKSKYNNRRGHLPDHVSMKDIDPSKLAKMIEDDAED